MRKDTAFENGVSIIMPTFQRPQDLPRALGSLLAQEPIENPVEIIVADNDPKASARDVISKFAAKSAVPIVYVHMPQPGVSNARNAAIAVARGRYIAWLDDDQEAAPNWLKELLLTSEKYDAGLVFCPSPPIMEVSTPLDEQYTRFFDRKSPEQDGLIEHFYGCGNSLLDLKRISMPSPVFDPIANETGGEDDLLFSFIQKNGAKTAWTSHTYVYEHVPAKRATPTYVRKRSFSWGQGPSEHASDEGDILQIIKWMLIGFAQTVCYAPMMVLTKLAGRKSYIYWLNKTFEGIGKIFWFRGLKPKLYGQVKTDATTKDEGKTAQVDHRANTQVQS